ncbi:MAG: hypothetical protein J2P37_36830 [Ktedonobacteraceae bacterium]|nr:hypothetical protein [Ktedonobacteraceae bacterium]MBO0794847.1 hypothetical protein [Ktedonobacteraceae bacterium]
MEIYVFRSPAYLRQRHITPHTRLYAAPYDLYYGLTRIARSTKIVNQHHPTERGLPQRPIRLEVGPGNTGQFIGDTHSIRRLHPGLVL